MAEQAVESAAHEPSGRGSEVRREQTSRANDSEAPVHWHERVLVLQSEEYAQAQETARRRRLETARTQLNALTARHGKGQRCYHTADALPAACHRILEKHAGVGLLTVRLACARQTRPVQAQRGRPRKHAPPPAPH